MFSWSEDRLKPVPPVQLRVVITVINSGPTGNAPPGQYQGFFFLTHVSPHPVDLQRVRMVRDTRKFVSDNGNFLSAVGIIWPLSFCAGIPTPLVEPYPQSGSPGSFRERVSPRWKISLPHVLVETILLASGWGTWSFMDGGSSGLSHSPLTSRTSWIHSMDGNSSAVKHSFLTSNGNPTQPNNFTSYFTVHFGGAIGSLLTLTLCPATVSWSLVSRTKLTVHHLIYLSEITLTYSHLLFHLGSLASVSGRVYGSVSPACFGRTADSRSASGRKVGIKAVVSAVQVKVYHLILFIIMKIPEEGTLNWKLRNNQVQIRSAHKKRKTKRIPKSKLPLLVDSIMSQNRHNPNKQDRDQDAESPPPPILSPPSFRSFTCASPKTQQEVLPHEQERSVIPDTPDQSHLDPRPVQDLTNDPEDSKVEEGKDPAFNQNKDKTVLEDHQCLSSSGSAAPSRHDALKNSDDNDPDSSNSEGVATFGRASGVVLDKENDGDMEVLRHLASGTSNITSDLDQLRPGSTPDSKASSPLSVVHEDTSPRSLPNAPDSRPDQRVHDDNSELPTLGEAPLDPSPDVPPLVAGTKTTNAPEKKRKLNSGNTKSPEAYQPLKDGNDTDGNIPKKREQDHDAAEREEMDKMIDDYLKSPDISTSDGSTSYDPMSSYDEGGRAGLDPDHSSEWVPYILDPKKSLSKAKKRRRRYQKKNDLSKQHDSLGKLLRGNQTKEDEEKISTFDLGNARRGGRGDNLDTSGIQGGNLFPKKKEIKTCDNRKSFGATASLNSTQFGEDFDNDQSMLREGSDVNNDIEDEIDEACLDAPKEASKDEYEDPEKEPVRDDSLSSNSTGTKRKRKRNKKKTGQTVPEDALPKETSRIGTRSKALQGKVIDPAPEVFNIVAKPSEVTEEQKGEKEKNPSSGGASQVAVFKSPPLCSRSDIQRIVSKAVFKSKNKISNNFAFNSKIQNFKISTAATDVHRIPDIDLAAPLVQVQVPEFIWPEEEKTMDGMVNVKTRGAIQFIILVRSGHAGGSEWDTPSTESVRDFASHLTCTIMELKLEFGGILRWTNPWGNVAIMGLDSSDLDLLMKFRTFLTTLRFDHRYFNTFPKDAMSNNFGLSVLLRSDLRLFREQFLAEALFARNNLYGVLDTLQSETFTASDTTRAGVSKNGWRNVTLEGDQEFLDSLRHFTSSHWFNVGPGSVQIHGGERRTETYEEIEARSKRKRFNMPAGQSLTSAAKASINNSLIADQKALAKNPLVPSARSQRAGPGRSVPPKKKK